MKQRFKEIFKACNRDDLKENDVVTAKGVVSGAILGILGIVVSIGLVLANWTQCETFTLKFPKDYATSYSDYYSISPAVDVAVYQASGNSSMKYNFYYKKRTASKWTTIASAVSFSKNGESQTVIIGNYPGGWFNDVQIKGYKTSGISTYSKIEGCLGY